LTSRDWIRAVVVLNLIPVVGIAASILNLGESASPI